MAMIPVTKQFCKDYTEFVIYNYFAEKLVVTKEQTQKELQERFDISLSQKQIDEIFEDYVRNGILLQRVRDYVYKTE